MKYDPQTIQSEEDGSRLREHAPLVSGEELATSPEGDLVSSPKLPVSWVTPLNKRRRERTLVALPALAVFMITLQLMLGGTSWTQPAFITLLSIAGVLVTLIIPKRVTYWLVPPLLVAQADSRTPVEYDLRIYISFSIHSWKGNKHHDDLILLVLYRKTGALRYLTIPAGVPNIDEIVRTLEKTIPRVDGPSRQADRFLFRLIRLIGRP